MALVNPQPKACVLCDGPARIGSSRQPSGGFGLPYTVVCPSCGSYMCWGAIKLSEEDRALYRAEVAKTSPPGAPDESPQIVIDGPWPRYEVRGVPAPDEGREGNG